MALQTKTQSKPTTRTAWQFACTGEDGRFSDCGYLIRNHELKELVRYSMDHAKQSHDMDVPADYFQGAAKKVTF